MEEKFICSICHKKVKEVVGFMGSKIKYCYKCHNKKLEDNCAFLREYILNSFSMKDQKRFLDEACKGKYFEEVLNNFKSEEVEQLKKENEELKNVIKEQIESHKKDCADFKNIINNMEINFRRFCEIAENEMKSAQNKVAVEKLEEVKKYCIENQEELLDEDNLPVGNAIGTDTHIYLAEMSLYEFIDTMIAEMKGEKDE